MRACASSKVAPTRGPNLMGLDKQGIGSFVDATKSGSMLSRQRIRSDYGGCTYLSCCTSDYATAVPWSVARQSAEFAMRRGF